jgi:heat shock protein HslJ
MKAIVGFGFFLLFLAGIALVMLQGRQMAQKNLVGTGASLTGVNWRPVVLGAESMPDDSGMFVQFEVDGSFKGHGGCNSFFGSLEQSDAGVSIGPIGATRMACPEPVMKRETAFITALQNTKQFELGRDKLHLLDGGRTLLAELVEGEQ